jgi:hypothetical protein
MRFCQCPEKITIITEVTEVPGDKPIHSKICGQWKDCGLMDKGLVKSIV